MESSRKFSREFKLEAIKLVRERGVSVAQAARDHATSTAAPAPATCLHHAICLPAIMSAPCSSSPRRVSLAVPRRGPAAAPRSGRRIRPDPWPPGRRRRPSRR